MSATSAGQSTAQESPSHRGKGEFTLIAVLFLFYAVAYLDKKLIAFLVGPIRESLGASDFQMSLVTGGAFVLFYVLFSFPIGWAVDRYSRRSIIFFGVVSWSIAAALGGFASSITQLLISRTGVGAGEAVLGPAGNSLVADTIPKERLTRATAATHAGVLLGSALAFALGGLILAFAADSGGDIHVPGIGAMAGWQCVLLFTGLPGVAFASLIFFVREPGRRGKAVRHTRKKTLGGVFSYLAQNKWFYLLHFIGFSLISICMAGFAAWMPSHLMRNYDIPIASLGGTLAVLQLTFGALGMFLPAWAVDRMFLAGRHDAHMRVFAFGAILMCVAGIVVGLAPTAVIAFCGIAAVDAMAGFLPVAGAALQLTTPNDYRGQITALFLVAYNIIGQGAGPVIVALITDYGFGDDAFVGASLALTFAVAAPLAALCLFAGMKAMRHQVALLP